MSHLAAEQASRQEALQRGERVAQASEGEECLPGEASGAFTVYNPEEGSEEAKFHAGDTDQDFPDTPERLSTLSRCMPLQSVSIDEPIGATFAASPVMSSSSSNEDAQLPSHDGSLTPFRCNYCSDQTCFTTRDELSRHCIAEHDDIGIQECPNCGLTFNTTHQCVLHWHFDNCWGDKGKGKATSPKYEVDRGPNDPCVVEFLLSVGFLMEHLESMGVVVHDSPYENVYTANHDFSAGQLGIHDTDHPRELPDLPTHGVVPNHLTGFQESLLSQEPVQLLQEDLSLDATPSTSMMAPEAHGEDAVSKRFHEASETKHTIYPRKMAWEDSDDDDDIHGENSEKPKTDRYGDDTTSVQNLTYTSAVTEPKVTPSNSQQLRRVNFRPVSDFLLEEDAMNDRIYRQLDTAYHQMASNDHNITYLNQDLQAQAQAQAEAVQNGPDWLRFAPVDRHITQQAHAIQILRRENEQLSALFMGDEQNEAIPRTHEMQREQPEGQGHGSRTPDAHGEMRQRTVDPGQTSHTEMADEETQARRLRRALVGLDVLATRTQGYGQMSVLHELRDRNRRGRRFEIWVDDDGDNVDVHGGGDEAGGVRDGVENEAPDGVV